MHVSWGPFYALATDGGRCVWLLWVPEFLRLIVITRCYCWAKQCSRRVTIFTLVYSSQQPSGILLLSCLFYRLNWDTEWLTNWSKITQPEVVESKVNPDSLAPESMILAIMLYVLCSCLILFSHLVPRLASEPCLRSFNLCMVPPYNDTNGTKNLRELGIVNFR